MVPNGDRRRLHYLAVKKLSVLLREMTSNHNGNFYCLNCLHSFATKNKLESHKKPCKNKDCCNVCMPSQDTNLIKADKAPLIIYEDCECNRKD